MRQDIVSPTITGTPFKGMIRFDTTTNTLQYYDGTTWQTVSTTAVAAVKNEGVVKIDGQNGNANNKPSLTFSNSDVNSGAYKYVGYSGTLSRAVSYWPENITSPTDANIVGTYNSNMTFIENPIIGQVHMWRIIGSFERITGTMNGYITIRLVNASTSAVVLQQIIPFLSDCDYTDFSLNFITIADASTIPAPTGSGRGYYIQIASEIRSTITINSITRVSNYKD